MEKAKTVCVYGASSRQTPAHYLEAARKLGKELADKNIHMINGAGRTGLMGACADACLSAGGQVTGVIPSFMIQEGWHHRGLTELIETPDMHSRKETMARLSDGIIALPGGVGTMEELLEIITWKQLGLYVKPIVILNTDGYYDALLQQFGQAVDEHFMRPLHVTLWQVAATPVQAVEQFLTQPHWDPSIRKFAAL